MRAALTGTALTLGRRQLYMLPTSFGVVLALLLIALLLASINYNNGLAYGLTFLLAAIGIVSMLYTHRNLHGLEVSAGHCDAVFVGEQARYPVWLHNPSAAQRLGIELRQHKRKLDTTDLAPLHQASIVLRAPALQRGNQTAPEFLLATTFPLGLLYSWSRRIQLDQTCLIYPQPSGERPLPLAAADRSGDKPGAADGDDFSGLRQFRQGDPPQHISWKTAARGVGLYTKQFHGAQQQHIDLRWQDLGGLPLEARLSQLCLWVLQAEQAGLPYSLQLPHWQIEPDSGAAHRHRCLKTLALYEEMP